MAKAPKPKGGKQNGGARPGAGRPPGRRNDATIKLILDNAQSGLTPVEFLTAIYRNDEVAVPDRIAAAIACARYLHSPKSPAPYAPTPAEVEAAKDAKTITVKLVEFREILEDDDPSPSGPPGGDRIDRPDRDADIVPLARRANAMRYGG